MVEHSSVYLQYDFSRCCNLGILFNVKYAGVVFSRINYGMSGPPTVAYHLMPLMQWKFAGSFLILPTKIIPVFGPWESQL